MNGRILLIVVLLLVLAIPLIASSDLGNTVVEFPAISTINNEEVPFNQQELFDSNIAILAVGLNKEHPINYIVSNHGESIFYNNNASQTVNYTNTIHGGVKRTNLRKH